MMPIDRAQYDQRIRDGCERVGIEKTRQLLAEGRYGERKAPIARAWLAAHDSKAQAAEKEIDRSIPREANEIARKALAQAKWANRTAVLALIVAITALVHDLLT